MSIDTGGAVFALHSPTPNCGGLLKRGHKPAEGFKEKDRFVRCHFLHILYKRWHFPTHCMVVSLDIQKFFSKWIVVFMQNSRSEDGNMVQV